MKLEYIIIKLITNLVCGVESTEPLPPPKHAANRLKEHSLLAIKQWMEKYGDGYPKLKLGYQYLKYNKKVCIIIDMYMCMYVCTWCMYVCMYVRTCM